MQTVSDGDTLHEPSDRCKENIINLSSAEFTPRVVMVKKINAFTFGYHFSRYKTLILTLCLLDKNFSRGHYEIFFLFLQENRL